MKKIPFILLVALFAITACAPAAAKPTATRDAPPTQQPSDSVPVPSDSDLVRGNVFLESTDLLTLENFPLQFTLMLKGDLPTPCNELRVAVSLPDSNNKIVVDVYSVSDPNAICAQVVEPFEENFPLGSFRAGHYTLWVNGEQVAEFDS